MSDLILILTTMPADSRAEDLARALIDEHLAACVSVHAPMVSVYRWQTAVERESERQMVIKTTRDKVQAIQTRLVQLHPYELPEFLIVSADASDAYGGWIIDAVGPQ